MRSNQPILYQSVRNIITANVSDERAQKVIIDNDPAQDIMAVIINGKLILYFWEVYSYVS